LGEITLKIHAACRARDANDARTLLSTLLSEWKRARDGLETFVRQYGAGPGKHDG
jgi:hypothetical protein